MKAIVAVKLVRLFAAACAFLCAAALPLAAQPAYPRQPVKLIVPFAAGGTTDILARIIAARLATDLGQQVVVENIDGAGGSVGAEAAARARPDGYTLIFHTSSTGAINAVLYPDLKYDMRRDFVPISLLTRNPNILVARKNFPANTLAEFIALAKKNPGKFNYGSSGNGTILHLAGALFAKQAGVNIVHVPYRGAGPAMNDLVAGVIDLMFDNLPSALVQIRAGNVKPLALTTKTRSPALPNLRTMAEQGFPTYETDTWGALFAPRGTPPAIIARLNKAAVAAMHDPATVKRLNDLGAVVVGSSPEELARFRDQQLTYWAPIVRDSGARIE
jgi:tripartite-type tricarboxylate transporter receptor subunit TctC